MKSRGWKLSVLALSALAMTACGQKKKNRPGSPYTGIWIERSSARAASTRVVGANGCAMVIHKSFIIQANGEVFTYMPDARLTQADARDSFLGSINSASVFAPIDNRRHVSSGFYNYGDMEATGLMPNAQLVRDGQFLIASSYGQSRIFVQVSEEHARRVWTQAVFCSDQQRGRLNVQPVPVVPVQPGVEQGGPWDQQGYGRPQQQQRLNQDDK